MPPVYADSLIQKAINFAQSAAHEAGYIIVSQRDSAQVRVSYKGQENNLLTSADLAAEKAIIGYIREHFPTHPILAEESSPSCPQKILQQGPLWVVDPVDGTTNYARGHVHVGVSIAFVLDGKVQAAVVHCPFLSETFCARRGAGATLNGKQIQVSQPRNLRSTLVVTGFPYQRDNLEPLVSRARQVLQHCQDLRRLGACSVDICWVASGRLDAYYETVSPWDMAAATLIAREAGAIIQHLSSPSEVWPEELDGNDLLVSAPSIANDLRSLLIGATSETLNR